MNQQERMKAHEQRMRQANEAAKQSKNKKNRTNSRQAKAVQEKEIQERQVSKKTFNYKKETRKSPEKKREKMVYTPNKGLIYSPEDAANQFHKRRQETEAGFRNYKLDVTNTSTRQTENFSRKDQRKKQTQKKMNISFRKQISKVMKEIQGTILHSIKQKEVTGNKKPSSTSNKRGNKSTEDVQNTVLTGVVRKVENRTSNKVVNKTQDKVEKRPKWLKLWWEGERKREIIMTACGVMLVLAIAGNIIGSLRSNSQGDSQNDNPIRNLIDIMKFEGTEEETKEETEEEGSKGEEHSNAGLIHTGIIGNYSIETAGGLVVDISRILCPDWIDRQFLTINEYSRPGVNMDSIQYIAIHYVGNPGTTAQNNRNYFETLKDEKQESKSAHFIVGLEGEVIQCIPLNEKSYATNHRNSDTISIEVCHPDTGGKFNDVTYDSVVKLTAWLCQQFGLTEDRIIRHYDVTGKNCPKYYVEHEDAWIQMKEDIVTYMEANPDIQ